MMRFIDNKLGSSWGIQMKNINILLCAALFSKNTNNARAQSVLKTGIWPIRPLSS